MKVVDGIGREIHLPAHPMRIVSLVPSQTELLVDLGLREALVGITKFCVHPVGLKSEKTIIGGTKKISIEKVKELEPDLIIGNKEENTKADIEALEQVCPVYITDIATPQDAVELSGILGQLTGKEAEGEKIQVALADAYRKLETEKKEHKKGLYLIWKEPFMAAGTDTYISNMLSLCGVSNVLEKWGTKGLRYPSLSASDIRQLAPDIILLSSEPYPFTAHHVDELISLTGIETVKVDGEAFSWYGSRPLYTLPYLIDFIKRIYA